MYFKLKMYSRRVRVPIPDGVTRLCVERPWVVPDCRETLNVASGNVTRICHDAGMTVNGLPVSSANAVEVSSEIGNPLAVSAIPSPAFSPWPILRKVLMEARDRLSPVLPIVNRYRYLTVALHNLLCYPEN